MTLRKIVAIWSFCLMSLAAQVPNDLYANPSHIGTVPDGFVLEGSYSGASSEDGEEDLYAIDGRRGTDPKQTVWFTFEVPSDGIWSIRVGYPSDWSPFNPSYPILFEDTTLAQAASMLPLENRPNGGKCMLRAGRTYRLGLRSYSMEVSYYEVEFKAVPRPGNDASETATMADANAFTIDPTGATFESGEFSGAEGDALGSAWFRWTAPSSGKWLLKSLADRESVLFIWPPSPTPLFPGPENTDTTEHLSWSPSGNNTYTRRGFSIFDDPSAAASMAGLGEGGNWILFDAEAGSDYWIAGYERWHAVTPISLVFEPAAPNDLRENALDLGDSSAVREAGDFLGASISEGETVPENFPVTRTVWLKWTARSDGQVHIKGEGYTGNPYPRVAVRTFSATGLTGDAVPEKWGREWRFEARTGETYHFQVSVDDHPNAGFQFRLLATEPTDRFVNAVVLDGRALVSNVGSTLEAAEPDVEEGEGSVWLKWYSGERQVVSINNRSMQALGLWNSPQSRIEVFRGAALENLASACDPISADSALFVAEADETYFIRVLSKEETDGESEVTVVAQRTGDGLEELLMEAGAILAMPHANRDTLALELVNRARGIAPEDTRVLLASAFLELRAAARTPSGRILAARIIPNFSDLLPLGFIGSGEAGPDGIIAPDLTLHGFFAQFDAATWPHLSNALGRLLAISEPAGTYGHPTLAIHASGKTRLPGNVTDAHDRRTIVAMVMALRGGFDYLSSLDATVPASEFFGWLCDGTPTIETLLARHPGFLTYGPDDNRFSAWLWMTAASEQADIAKELYQAPIFTDSDNSLYTQNAQGRLDRWFGWVRSANGPVEIGWNGRADFSRWLFGSVPPRTFLPKVTGNRLQPYSIADVTWGGLLPDLTEKSSHDSWAVRGWLAHHEELEDWLERHFPVNTPDSGEDADGDGIPLLHEFAFGLSPTQRDPAPYQPGFRRQQMQDGTWRSEITFRRRISQTRAVYSVHRSTDMATWETVDVPENAEPDLIPGFERVKVLFPDGPQPSDRAFFRIRYRRPNSDGGSGVISVTN